MLLLYGANGYTGRLMLDACLRQGIRPIVAGRRADALATLAAPHGLEVRAFGLDDPQAIAAGLQGVRLVLHAAGPFFRTSAPMLRGCLAAGAHYLDITGEIAVFEACRAQDAPARAAGVVVLPGSGFDVVPTDCVAATLAAALPGSTLLELAFAGGGSFSRGTLKTMVLGMDRGGAIRRDGRIVPVPPAWKAQEIPFRDRPRLGVTIPWGDVSTAHWSTRIPDIHTYLAMPARARRAMGWLAALAPALRVGLVRRGAERLIDATVTGPSAQVRASARMHVWGRVTHPDGRTREATAEVPEGYRFTAIASVACAQRVLAGGIAPGYHTPSSAFGASFLTTLPECDLELRAP